MSHADRHLDLIVSPDDMAVIAAAPVMLATLEEIATECAACSGAGNVVVGFHTEPCTECADLRGIIALAKVRP